MFNKENLELSKPFFRLLSLHFETTIFVYFSYFFTCSFSHQDYYYTLPCMYISFLILSLSSFHSITMYLLCLSYPSFSHTPHHMPIKPHPLSIFVFCNTFLIFFLSTSAISRAHINCHEIAFTFRKNRPCSFLINTMSIFFSFSPSLNATLFHT